MSSHREAPEVSKDPVIDSTDLYTFISPDKPDTVTIIANYIPFQAPAAGPNFYEFGDDVQYGIHIDNNGDSKADITYTLDFSTKVRDINSFLYNTGPIKSLNDTTWNRPQTYTVSKTVKGKTSKIGQNLPCPPCNIGPLSTSSYESLASAAVLRLKSGETVFAGQRCEGFYVDLGSIFDLVNLRPFQNLNLFAKGEGFTAAAGVDALSRSNVHSIALQVPLADLTSSGKPPASVTDKHAVIGVWTTASRRKSTIRESNGSKVLSGPYVQVSRLGNPLINEVVIPSPYKDMWNASAPVKDSQFASHYAHPMLVTHLVELYPGVFPNLGNYKKSRVNLEALLLTGLPSGIVPNFTNFTGKVQADMLRLNLAIPPSSNPNILGLLGGDPAGFPNGRRVFDDVVSIELRCIAGVTLPLVNPSYSPDAAAGEVTDGLTPSSLPRPYLNQFPYLGVPLDGYDTPSS